MTFSPRGMPAWLRASSRQSNAARSCAKHDPERNVLGCSQTLKNDTLTHPSALSQLNCRVNRFEFRSGIVDPHLPVNATLGGVDIVRPGFCFLTQTGDSSEAAVCDALVRERTQCILSDVQPTAMLRRVAEREASHQGASTLGGKRFIERALGVGVEVVAHQD